MRARHAREQIERGLETGLERLEVAVVHADHGRAQGHRALELGSRVDLDEGGEPDALGGMVQISQPRLLQGGGDQEHGIRPRRPRFPELILVQDEFLAENRQVDGGADGHEVLERAAEVFLIGEDGDGGGSRRGIVTSLARGVERGVQRALGGRSALHFGDEPDPAGGGGPERRLELAGRTEPAARRFERGQGPRGADLPELFELVGDDVVEHAHQIPCGADAAGPMASSARPEIVDSVT